jgi:hypothetical protein
MDLSQVLLKVMSLYGEVQRVQDKVKDLHNEVQMLITTKAHAEEIKIEDPDA